MPLFPPGTGVDEDIRAAAPQLNDAAGGSASPPSVRVKNRRMTYLQRHPSYFGPELELAGVLLLIVCVN